MTKRTLWTAALLSAFFAGSASAATFNIVYDDFADQSIGDIVGTATFSYDGPVTTGAFALDSLTGISFSARFINGESYETVDIDTDLSATGIFVFDAGDGLFGLVFTGAGGVPSGGSLDLFNAVDGTTLTHEPTDFGIDDPIGCCGGNGLINLYQSDLYFGDYQALTAIPVPAAVWLFGSALMGLGALRRTKSA